MIKIALVIIFLIYMRTMDSAKPIPSALAYGAILLILSGFDLASSAVSTAVAVAVFFLIDIFEDSLFMGTIIAIAGAGAMILF